MNNIKITTSICGFPQTINENSGTLRRGADKSLALPGRKQATATKLGIYSTYSPQSSTDFLACCPNFCNPLKRFRIFPSNQVSAAAMISASDEKLRPFNCFFQSKEQVVVRWNHIRRIGWVIKTLCNECKPPKIVKNDILII